MSLSGGGIVLVKRTFTRGSGSALPPVSAWSIVDIAVDSDASKSMQLFICTSQNVNLSINQT